MKLFNPSELQSQSFHDLQAGQCFFDTDEKARTVVFALASGEGDGQRFLVPLSGAGCLVATPMSPRSGDYGAKRVLPINLVGSFSVRFDSDPVEGRTAHSGKAPLLVTRNGPAIYTHVLRHPAVPMQRDGFLLNLATFECDFVDDRRRMEIVDAIAIERWSLVFNAEPNLGTVFFQHPAQRKDLEKAA